MYQEGQPRDANWIVAMTDAMRQRWIKAQLAGVTDIEQRIAIVIAARAMDYNDLRTALAGK
jgi:hypothetical protein